MSTVVCPKCRERTEFQPTDRDQKLRCPTCGVILRIKGKPADAIEPGGDAKSRSGGIPRKTHLPARGGITRNYGRDETEEYRPRKRLRDEDEEFDEDRPRPRRRNDDRIAPDDPPRGRYRDEEDDLPPRRGRDVDDDVDDDFLKRRNREFARTKRSSPLLLIGLCSVGGLLIILTLVGGFVWPGFFLGKRADGPQGGGDGTQAKDERFETLMSFAPAESCFVGGINVAAALKMPGMQRFLKEMKANMGKEGPPEELYALIDDVDRVVISGGQQGKTPFFVVSVSFLKPHAKELRLLAEKFKMKSKENDTFDLTSPVGETMRLVILDDHVCAIGSMDKSKDSIGQLMDKRKTKPQLTANLEDRVRQVQNNLLWAVAANQGVIQEKLQEFKPADFPGPESLLTALKQAKMASVVYDLLPSKESSLEVTLDCAQNGDAEQVKNFLNKYRPKLDDLKKSLAMVPPMKDLLPIIDDVSKTLKIDQNGPRIAAQVRLKNDLGDLVQIPMQIWLGMQRQPPPPPRPGPRDFKK